MTRNVKIFLCLCAVTLAIAGCMSHVRDRYSDRTIEYAPAAARPKIVPQICTETDLAAAQNNPACIGKTFRDPRQPNGGTITIMKPGPAMPVAEIGAEQLPPPTR